MRYDSLVHFAYTIVLQDGCRDVAVYGVYGNLMAAVRGLLVIAVSCDCVTPSIGNT